VGGSKKKKKWDTIVKRGESRRWWSLSHSNSCDTPFTHLTKRGKKGGVEGEDIDSTSCLISGRQWGHMLLKIGVGGGYCKLAGERRKGRSKGIFGYKASGRGSELKKAGGFIIKGQGGKNQ